eukprot:31121-Chlamydomonas_euryale.AAC.9
MGAETGGFLGMRASGNASNQAALPQGLRRDDLGMGGAPGGLSIEQLQLLQAGAGGMGQLPGSLGNLEVLRYSQQPYQGGADDAVHLSSLGQLKGVMADQGAVTETA